MSVSRLRRAGVGTALAVGSGVLLGGCGPQQPWVSELVSVTPAGTPGNDTSAFPVLSPDGDLVAFSSWATDLVPGSGAGDLFVRDLDTGELTLVSAAEDGAGGGDGTSGGAFFSEDGATVVFGSYAGNMTPDSADQPLFGQDVFARDMATGEVTLLTPNAAGVDTSTGDSSPADVTADAGLVLVDSYAGDLVVGDTNDTADLYVRDVAAGTTSLVSATPSGGVGNGASGSGTFTAGGSAVVFGSFASDLVATDTNGRFDVFVRDLATGTTTLVSTDATGADSAGADSFPVGASPDGSRVYFATTASDLGPTDTNGSNDVYAHDLATGANELVTTNATGADSPESGVGQYSLSPDGTKLAFVTSAGDLGPVDSDNCVAQWNPVPVAGPCPDAYVTDLTTGTTELVTVNATGTDSAGRGRVLQELRFSADGRHLAFVSGDAGLGPSDRNGDSDVYVRDLDADRTTLVSHAADQSGAGDAGSYGVSIGPDGGRVAYHSLASNLGPDDANERWDVYVATFTDADLAVSLTASPDPVPTGGRLVYALGATADGPDVAEGAALELLLLPGSQLVEAAGPAGPCTSAARPDGITAVTCPVGDLEPGDTAAATVTVDVTASPGTTLTAVAEADATTPDSHGDDNATPLDVTVT